MDQEASVAAGTGVGMRSVRPVNTRWNFIVLGADMAFFGLGLSVSSAYTVLPLFVHHLTSNNLIISLIPAVRALGLYGPQLLVAPLVERRRHVLPYIIGMTVLERVPYLVIAAGALWLAASHPGWLLGVFFLMLFIALLAGGLTYPAWLDLISRAVPGTWLGRFFGVWTGIGGVLGIGGAALSATLIATVPWPLNFVGCFVLTFASMVISFVLLTLGREPERTASAPARSAIGESAPSEARSRLGAQAREIWALVRNDGGLRRLIFSNGLVGISTMAGGLFAVTALRLGGLSDAQVGVQSTVLIIATTAGNFLWGTVGDRFGHRIVLVWGSLCAGLSALLALGAHGFWAYSVIFVLLGLNFSAVTLAGFTLITEFGPAARRPTYVALASVAYAPFAIGAPLIGGFLADTWGYTPVFVVAAVAGIAAMGAFQFWVPARRRDATAVAPGS